MPCLHCRGKGAGRGGRTDPESRLPGMACSEAGKGRKGSGRGIYRKRLQRAAGAILEDLRGKQEPGQRKKAAAPAGDPAENAAGRVAQPWKK